MKLSLDIDRSISKATAFTSNEYVRGTINLRLPNKNSISRIVVVLSGASVLLESV
jgi:hypothetical protein